jgi:hypothetical protein
MSLLAGALAYGIVLIMERQAVKRRSDAELRTAIAETEALDANWRWDNVNAARKQPPDEQNAALLITRIRSELPPNWGTQLGSESLAHKLDLASNVRLPETIVAEARRELSESADVIKLARSLKDYPIGYSEIPAGSSVAVLESTLSSEAKLVIGVLTWDTRVAIESQSDHSVADNLIATLNISRSLGLDPLLSSQIVRFYARSTAIQLIERAIAQSRSRQDLERLRLPTLQAELQSDTDSPAFLAALRGERARIDRFLERMENGTLEDFARMGKEKVPSIWNLSDRWTYWVFKAEVPEARAFLLRSFNTAIQLAERPLHEQISGFESLPEPPGGIAHSFSRLLQSVTVLMARTYWRNQAEARCAIVGIACERFRLRNDHWPEALSELTPEFIKELPLDPYNGEALRYTQLDNGVVISSVGPKLRGPGEPKSRPGLPDNVAIGFRLWNIDKRSVPPQADKEEQEKDPP